MKRNIGVKSNCNANPKVYIKGRLKNHLDYWEFVIGANAVVTSVVKEGYKIPFIYTPQKAYFKNNKSALRNNDFVTDSIIDLLASKLVKETNNIPHVVSPLSVAENSVGKKRLILDLRYVNKHIYTHKVKFDDWKCFQNFLNAGSKFMFKFDLKSGYHHVDINETFQTYLRFSWKIAGEVRHFVFTVFPLGLNSASFLFTKIARPLVKYWRRHLIKIECFLDDGLSVAESFSEAICNSQFLQETLQKSGSIVNCENQFGSRRKLRLGSE